MAKKTNCTINGKEYYRIYRKVGMKVGKYGIWVDDRKAFYGTCKSDAERQYNEYMARKKSGTVDNRCLGQIIDQWLDTVFKAYELAEGTKANYIRAYNNIFRTSQLAGRPAADVTALDLQEFYNGLEVPYGAIKPLHNLLRRFFKYADLNGICKDITGSVTVPKESKDSDFDDMQPIDVWEDSDLKKVIAVLEGTTLRLLVVLAANTGARFSELLALTYDDIRDKSLYINKQVSEVKTEGSKGIHTVTTKTYTSKRVIPLSDMVLAEVRKHTAIHKEEMLKKGYRTDNIFTTSTGRYYYRRNVSRSLERLYKRIGVPYHRFHAYRHTFGTNLSRAGVPIEETCKLMGHSDISITAKYYVNISAERKREAVEKIVSFSL